MEAVMEATAVYKAYGDVTVVDDVTLQLSRGEILGLVGPNGAGKSTLIECLIGLQKPDAGTIRTLGLDPWSQGARLRARVGIQLQGAALPDRLRVEEALWMFSAYYPAPAEADSLMRDWGLERLRRRAFADLSGGERQRLLIALAMLTNPELVVFDELTTALDSAGRRETWRLLRRLRDAGLSAVLVTHDLYEAERLCDRIAVMRDGRLIASGTPQDVAAGLPLEDAILELTEGLVAR